MELEMRIKGLEGRKGSLTKSQTLELERSTFDNKDIFIRVQKTVDTVGEDRYIWIDKKDAVALADKIYEITGQKNSLVELLEKKEKELAQGRKDYDRLWDEKIDLEKRVREEVIEQISDDLSKAEIKRHQFACTCRSCWKQWLKDCHATVEPKTFEMASPHPVGVKAEEQPIIAPVYDYWGTELKVGDTMKRRGEEWYRKIVDITPTHAVSERDGNFTRDYIKRCYVKQDEPKPIEPLYGKDGVEIKVGDVIEGSWDRKVTKITDKFVESYPILLTEYFNPTHTIELSRQYISIYYKKKNTEPTESIAPTESAPTVWKEGDKFELLNNEELRWIPVGTIGTVREVLGLSLLVSLYNPEAGKVVDGYAISKEYAKKIEDGNFLVVDGKRYDYTEKEPEGILCCNCALEFGSKPCCYCIRNITTNKGEPRIGCFYTPIK